MLEIFSIRGAFCNIPINNRLLTLLLVSALCSHSDSFGAVESVKAASDVYMPVAGEIVEVNNVSLFSNILG